MNRPLHKEAQDAKKESSSHAGLWFDRFFNQYDAKWKVSDQGKTTWINGVAGSVGDSAMLASYCNRQQALIACLQGKSLVMATDWHLVSGMGNNHPVENGFAWHPTLGVPYLTGAAVKGLLRAWCEVWAEGFDADKLKLWFGDTDQAGALIFFDAVSSGKVQLKADIMTPHYGGWYLKGDQPPAQDGSNVPADWHDPIPLPFLVVDKGVAFHFSFANRPGYEVNLAEVQKELKEALEWLGAGAKTAAGYGRMKLDEAAQQRADKEIKKAQEEKDRNASIAAEAEQAQQEAAKKGYVGLASDIYQQAKAEKWDSDKQTFMQAAKLHLPTIQSLDAGDEKQQAVELLIEYLEKHNKGIMADPHKTQGKKNKPTYKDGPKNMALALQDIR